MATKIVDYDLGECGRFQYAQWLHPLEAPKNFTQDEVKLWPGLRDKPIALDIGAHTGDTAVLMALNYKKVFAFEPNPIVFEVLCENARLNPQIVPVNSAIMPKGGWTEFQYGGQFCNGGYQGEGVSIEVSCLSLMLFLQAHGIHPNSVGLLKIDAEGYDSKILLSAINLLHYGPIVQVENYLGLHTEAIMKIMKMFPYHPPLCIGQDMIFYPHVMILNT